MMEPVKQETIKIITLEEKILKENDFYAEQNRKLLRSHGIYTLNLQSAPGSGKTALLTETLRLLKDRVRCGVIEGDQQTCRDAGRIAETGVPVVQINTLQSCHLNAALVQRALENLPLKEIDLLFIENVGNLICPAAFDLGEEEKTAVLSITEGEDKPQKYPLLFSLASVTLLSKTDLLPYLRFDSALVRQQLLGINPKMRIIETSAFTGLGLPEWIDYLMEKTGKNK